MAITWKQPLGYYSGLFTSQYQNSTNGLAWMAAKWQLWDDLTNCIELVNGYFNLSAAVGVQLDYIGGVIGVSRILPFQPSGGVSPTLDDTTYRLLLYATQAKYRWDGHTASLYPIWQTLFPGGSIVINDNQNMTCTILVSGMLTSIEKDLISNGFIVPRPEGVLYTYTFGTGPFFGADLNNAFIAGADLGYTI